MIFSKKQIYKWENRFWLLC